MSIFSFKHIALKTCSFGLSNSFSEFNETSVIHCLTGWLPEPIPLKYNVSFNLYEYKLNIFIYRYTHAKKVWEFLRYDRSNKLPGEFDSEKHKNDQQPVSPTSGSGPIPLFKWPEQRTDLSEEFMSIHVCLVDIVLNFHFSILK